MRTSCVLSVSPDGRARTSTDNHFLEWIAGLSRESGLAVDTETAGLGWADAVRLVQFGTSERGFAVDVAHREGRQLVSTALTAYRGPLLFHNAGFDIRALARIEQDPEYLWPRAIDTYVCAHVQNPDRLNGLDPLAKSILGADEGEGYKKQFRAMMRKRKWTWGTVPRLLLTPYGVEDVRNTHRLYQHFLRTLSADEWAVVDMEREVAWAVWSVERRGMRLDREYAITLRETWTNDLDADREWFRRTYGVENPNANRQLTSALQKQGWVPSARTPSGEIKLDKAILKSLKGQYELVDRLLEYKRKTKWLAAYVENCLEEVDAAGYVHASYNSLGAKTGRMSCSSPPLQQLPKGGGGEIRRLFVASPGNVIASVDYSAIEFRLAGAFSGEERIIDVYQAGGDWYQQVADDIGCDRASAKVVVLASLYGAGGAKIASGLGIGEAEGKKLVTAFWRKYPKLNRWARSTTSRAAAGEPIKTPWGRTLKPHAPYAAPNAQIQGTAAEVLKDGIMRLWQKDLLKFVCAIVHDEVVLDVPRDEAEAITAQVAEVLEDRTFACPLTAAGTVYGESWGAGYAA